MKVTMICLFIAVTFWAAFEVACYLMGFNTHLEQGPTTLAIEIIQAALYTIAIWLFGYAFHSHRKKKFQEKWNEHLQEISRHIKVGK